MAPLFDDVVVYVAATIDFQRRSHGRELTNEPLKWFIYSME
jgi:hypothetical protein